MSYVTEKLEFKASSHGKPMKTAEKTMKNDEKQGATMPKGLFESRGLWATEAATGCLDGGKAARPPLGRPAGGLLQVAL